MSKQYYMPILDGTICGFGLYIIGEYSVSLFATQSVWLDAFIVVIYVLISLISRYALLRKKSKNEMLKRIGISFLSFMFMTFLVFLNYFTFQFSVFPHRALVDIDGFFILLMQGAYLITGIFARAAMTIVFFIKNMIVARKKQLL